ncbi:MAG: hypothetical protein KDB03_00490 [Planctomycetales bacterium]|nr:hypothetical protein [Planctomycetales bacterium]
MKLHPYSLVILALVCCSFSTVGCKSASWKSPASLFSWNREPSVETLVGQGNSATPESPASKYTANPIVSADKSPSTGGGYSATPSYASNNSSSYGNASSGVAVPGAGLAAKANGYQTGPYSMSSSTASAVPGVGTNAASSNLATNLPNPYGGSYASTPGVSPSVYGNPSAGYSSGASTPNSLPIPSSVQQSMASANVGAPLNSIPSPNSGGFNSGSPNFGSGGPNASLASTSLPANSLPPTSSLPSMPQLGSSAGSSYTLGAAGGNAVSLPSNPLLSPSSGVSVGGSTSSSNSTAGATHSYALPGTTLPSNATTLPSSYSGVTTAAGYRPGTVSRSTKYDFSQPGTTGVSNTANSSSGSVDANPLLR